MDGRPDTDLPLGPEAAIDASPHAQGTPIPGTPPSGTADGALRLDTGLLGPLLVPGGAARTAELEALSDKAVARLVKQAAGAARLDPALFSGHSLRAGLPTAAGEAGAGLADLMRQTRHASTEVALVYLRPTDFW